MKRTLFLTAIISAALLLVFSAGCWLGHGPGCFGDPGKMIDKEIKDLNLTTVQKTRLDEIRKSIENDMKTHREKIEGMRSDIKRELDKPNPDINALAEDIKNRLSSDPNPGVKMADYFTQFYNILDKDQQKIMIEKIRKWEKKHPANMCPGKFDKKGKERGCPMAG